MPKYTKEQLLAMPIEELQSMAVTMKTPNCTSSIREQLVYDIIDAQADEVSNGVEAAPRRRRITTYGQDHVYSATQTGNSERFDSARDERAAKKMVAEKARETEAEAVKALLDAGQVEEPPKRRRGRPTKAEVEQRRAYEEMMFRQKKMMHQAQLSSNALISEANDAETEAEDALPPFMRQPIEHPHVMESYVPGVGTEKENASATEGASIETENAAHTAQSTVSGTAANDADNEDLPDFILAQIRQQANAPAVATTAEQEETSDEKLPNLHNPLETLTQRFQTQSHARFGNLPALEKAPEGEFVIVEDVPIIDNTNFNFIPEAEEPSFYGVPEVTQAPRFRKFKDDALVNPQLLNRTEGGQWCKLQWCKR